MLHAEQKGLSTLCTMIVHYQSLTATQVVSSTTTVFTGTVSGELVVDGRFTDSWSASVKQTVGTTISTTGSVEVWQPVGLQGSTYPVPHRSFSNATEAFVKMCLPAAESTIAFAQPNEFVTIGPTVYRLAHIVVFRNVPMPLLESAW